MSTPKQPADLPRESTDPTSEPRNLGRYQLLAKIASGGMASVYLARSGGAAGFEKLVALKRIHPHLAEEQNFVDMFLDEARIASRLQHANVCSVFDFGEADGSYFIAMEYLVGEPFARVLKAAAKSRKHYEDPRHPYLVARAIADAAEGLHAAHELRGRDGELLNVVHRDISPQNLFLTYEGNVKVVDFGIASAADRVHHTQGGEVKGKFSYMAPEQAKGAKGGALDRRADVFALGIVLWEMLTLKRLFRRDTPAETLYALIGEDIPLPSTQRPNIPAEIDPIVMKALARNPAERYTNARELGRDLLRFVGRSGEPVGMADLADWMERLLPEERALSRKTVDAAQSGDAASVVLQPSHAGDLSGSDVVAAESSKVHMRPETGAKTRPSMAPKPNLTPSGARPRQSTGATPAPRTSGAVAVPVTASAASLAPRPARRPSTAPPPMAPSPPAPTRHAMHAPDLDGDTVEATAPGVFEGGDFDGAPTTFHAGASAGGGAVPAFASPPTGPIPQRKIVTAQVDRGEPRRSPLILVGGLLVGLVVLVGGGIALMKMKGGGGETVVATTPGTNGTTIVPPPLVPIVVDNHSVVTPPPPVDDHVPGIPPANDHGAVTPPVEHHTPGATAAPTPDVRGTDHATKTGHTPHTPHTPHVPASSDTTGFVQIVTPGGWANVFDAHGRALGQAPGRFELPPGHQTLSLRPLGQPPNLHADVTVTAGQTVTVRVPIPGG